MKNPYVLLIDINPTLSILGQPNDAVIAVAYDFFFQYFGGTAPYVCTVIGSVPAGWTFNAATGELSNASPTTAGHLALTLQLRDAEYKQTPPLTFHWDVIALPLQLTGHIAGGASGSAAIGSYAASGGVAPYTYTVLSGTFPTSGGLSSAGVATGTWSAAGSYSWIVRVTDALSNHVDLADSCTITFVALTAAGSFAENAPGTPLAGSVAISGGLTPYGVSVLSGTPPPGSAFGIVGSTCTSTGNVAANASGAYAWTLRFTSADLQHFDLPCSANIVMAAQSLRAKIAAFWGFNSSVADAARTGLSYGGTVSYVAGVGGRNKLAAPATQINTGTTQAACVGANCYHSSQKFSIGGFFQPTTLAPHFRVGAVGTSSPVFGISSTTGKWRITINTSTPTATTCDSTTAAVVGTNAHVVGTWDGTNIKIYVNGVLENTVAGPSNVNLNSFINYALTNVAAAPTTTVQDLFYAHGDLTAAEAAWMYNAGAGRAYATDVSSVAYGTTYDAFLLSLAPTGFYKLNQTSGSVATDSSTLGNGTMNGTAAFQNTIAAPSGFGTDFTASFNNGGNGACSLPGINFTSGGLDYTMGGFFYPQTFIDADGSVCILASDTNLGDARNIEFQSVITGQLVALRGAGGSVNGSAVNPTATSANTWYHMFGMFDNSHKLLMDYINGIIVKGTFLGATATAVNCTNHTLAASGALSGRRIKTLACRYSFFKSLQLTPPQIAQLYDLGH